MTGAGRAPLLLMKTSGVWVLMVCAVGLHVLDEAVTGFLPFYNEQVSSLRAQVGFFPAPTFTFPVWITGLTIAVALGSTLTPIVARGGQGIRVVCGVLAVLMVGNACGHMLGSVYFHRLLPGFWSSPVLFVTSAWMLTRAVDPNWRGKSGGSPS